MKMMASLWKMMSLLAFFLKLADKLDEVAVTVLAKVLGAQVRNLILGLGVVDADLDLHQLLP